MSKRPNLFPTDINVSAPTKTALADTGTIEKTTKPAKGENSMLKTSLYMSHAVHDKLREIAYHERVRVHDLVIEGLDLVLEKRRYPSTSEITKTSKDA